MIQNVGPQFTQWDTGRIVSVSDSNATHIHFANQGDSKAVIIKITDGTAKVPDYLFQTGKTLIAYAVLDGVTLESKSFAVRKRERPENYIYEEDQRNFIYELITNAENAINEANTAAENANKAASGANLATTNANSAAKSANEASDNANLAANNANDATTKAVNAVKNMMIVGVVKGDVISVNDAIDQTLVGLRVFGKTTQDGTPTPDAPVDLVSVGDNGSVGVTVAGKNIFRFTGNILMENGSIISSTPNGCTVQGIDGGVTPGSTAWSNGWVHFDRASDLYLTKGSTITLSADYTVLEKHPSVSDRVTILLEYGSTGGTLLEISKAEIGVKYRISKTFVITEDGKYKRTTFTTHSSKVRVENVQWEIGGAASDFVPFKEQTLYVATPNGLPGILVTSGGNYTDEKGQQWICDEIDFARGVYVQRVGAYEVNGLVASNVTPNTDGNKWKPFPDICIYDALLNGTMANAVSSVLNTKFPMVMQKQEDNDAVGTVLSVYGHGSYTELRFRLMISEYETAELAVKAMNGTVVYYPLATPVETPLSAEELAAYASLHTYKDHTTVSNDAGAYMELEYVMDAKKYIDSVISTGILPATVE